MTTPYDPATSLPADATDEQIIERYDYVFDYVEGIEYETCYTAREFAAAVKAATVAEYEAKLALNTAERAVIDAGRRWLAHENGPNLALLFDAIVALNALSPETPNDR